MPAFIIHGARGSYPVSGKRFVRYGGRTSCFSVETPDGVLIIDAGTGIVPLGEKLNRRKALPPLTLLFTHFHLDHLIGLPAFLPLRRRDARVTLMADASQAGRWRGAIQTMMARPYWPLTLRSAGARIRFQDLPRRGSGGVSGPLTVGRIRIFHCAVSHPQGCVSYRLELPNLTIVLATDREQDGREIPRAFQQLCRGTDVLVHDAQFTPQEYPRRRGWGHSTWQHSVRVAAQAGAKRLVLVSHDPKRTDAQVDEIVGRAARVFPNTVGATEGLTIS